LGAKEKVKLLNLITEDLHHVLNMMKNDANLLAQGDLSHVGQITLIPDWEERLPRIIHRYEKEIRRVYNSFNDPEGADEGAWIDAHLHATMEFLIKHGLAERTNSEAIV
jgi:predicted KAP-like P-loop ATPase